MSATPCSCIRSGLAIVVPDETCAARAVHERGEPGTPESAEMPSDRLLGRPESANG